MALIHITVATVFVYVSIQAQLSMERKVRLSIHPLGTEGWDEKLGHRPLEMINKSKHANACMRIQH